MRNAALSARSHRHVDRREADLPGRFQKCFDLAIVRAAALGERKVIHASERPTRAKDAAAILGGKLIVAITNHPRWRAAANLGAARCLLVAIPDAFEGGQVVEQARALNPGLSIVARAHSEAEVLHLKKHGASVVTITVSR